MSKKKVVLLGATGSIGQTTLEILRQYPQDFELIGVSAYSNSEKLAKIAQEFRVPYASISKKPSKSVFPSFTHVYEGEDGPCELASLKDADIVLIGIVGMAGLKPTFAAIRSGKTIALANKESLVSAGSILMPLVYKHKARLLPVDSEHNAVFQCLQGSNDALAIRKVILTASGGPFRTLPSEKFARITCEQALKHPNFSMGPKITIDSATLANKGLELMEARWLFGLNPLQLDVVVHPEQKIHALIEFVDGSLLAQIVPPSMYFPIQHCLFYPNRRITNRPTVDFCSSMSWNFETESLKKFPCFQLAKECLKADGIWPTVFNSANEVAVKGFLENKITFNEIPEYIEKALNHFKNFTPDSLEMILAVDIEVRNYLKAL